MRIKVGMTKCSNLLEEKNFQIYSGEVSKRIWDVIARNFPRGWRHTLGQIKFFQGHSSNYFKLRLREIFARLKLENTV